jgi:AcrR family transcriptional regulator
MVLKQCMIKLLGQKPVELITVKELCETADNNRSTFYAHFKDPYDLLRQIENELLGELETHLQKIDFGGNETETFQLMKSIFEYIVDNADLCRALMGEYGDIAFLKEIMMIIQKQRLGEWESRNEFDAEMIRYATLFGVNGSIGVIQEWLQSDMKISVSDMATFIFTLMYQGLSPYVNAGLPAGKRVTKL